MSFYVNLRSSGVLLYALLFPGFRSRLTKIGGCGLTSTFCGMTFTLARPGSFKYRILRCLHTIVETQTCSIRFTQRVSMLAFHTHTHTHTHMHMQHAPANIPVPVLCYLISSLRHIVAVALLLCLYAVVHLLPTARSRTTRK
jgi:hypothetical protein